jgi:hypothetical protein
MKRSESGKIDNNKKLLVFKNQKGELYFVKSTKTKTGKTTYVITKQMTAECVTELPEDYEVSEIPTSGQLIVRKKVGTAFKPEDIRLIETELEKNKALYSYKVEARKNLLSIYVKEQVDTSIFKEYGSHVSVDKIMKAYNYEEMMRVKVSTEDKAPYYLFERYNFRGSYDDWMPIGSGNDLSKLAQKFIKHLGHESYFEIECGF